MSAIVAGTCGTLFSNATNLSLRHQGLHNSKRRFEPQHSFSTIGLEDDQGYRRVTILLGDIPTNNPTAVDFDDRVSEFYEPDAFDYEMLTRTITSTAPANKQMIGFLATYGVYLNDVRLRGAYGWIVLWDGSSATIKKRISKCCIQDLKRETVAEAVAYFNEHRDEPELELQDLTGSDLEKSSDYGTTGNASVPNLAFTYLAPIQGIRKFIPKFESDSH